MLSILLTMSKNTNLPLIVLGIVTLVLAVLVARTLFLGVRQESANLIATRGVLIDFENKSKNLKSFQTTYGDCQENLAKMDQLFVDKEEPIAFIEFLEKEAKNFHLAIDITPLNIKEAEGDPWPSISFRLVLNGSFPNFLRFLEKVESSPYLISLTNFDLKKPTDKTNGDVSVTFQMKTYTQKP